MPRTTAVSRSQEKHKCNLLSLIGKLAFAAHAVPADRLFLCRLIDLSTKVKKLHKRQASVDVVIIILPMPSNLGALWAPFEMMPSGLPLPSAHLCQVTLASLLHHQLRSTVE